MKLQLTDRLLQVVLAEAQVVCVGQPILSAGDLNDDPAVIHCLAKGISAGGMLIWLLRILWELVLLLMLLVGLVGRRVLVLVGIFLWAVLVLLLLLRFFMSLIGGSLLTFQDLLAFVLVLGLLMLLALLLVGLFGLHAGWILLIGPLRRLLVWFRMSGMFIGRSLGWFLTRLFLLLGMPPPQPPPPQPPPPPQGVWVHRSKFVVTFARILAVAWFDSGSGR